MVRSCPRISSELPPFEIRFAFLEKCAYAFFFILTAECKTEEIGFPAQTFSQSRSGCRLHGFFGHSQSDRTFFRNANGDSIYAVAEFVGWKDIID